MVQMVEKYQLNIAKSYIQWISAFGVLMLIMQTGFHDGWLSPNLARLTAKDSVIPLTSNEASWVVSCMDIGGLFGIIVGIICMEFLGSKRTIIVSFIVFSISWICLIIANSTEWLYSARLLGGITYATTYSSLPVYIGEVGLPRIRGTLISIAAGGRSVGVILGTVAETYLPMKISSSIYLASCLITIILFIWLMDSPYYLVKSGNLNRARKSLAFYYAGCDEEKELNEVKTFVAANANQTICDKLRELNVPVVRKSMFLIIILFAFPILCGNIIITGYMEIILSNAKLTLIKPQEFVIYANIIGILSTYLTVNLSDKFGRRVMLIVPSIGTSIAMISLGLHFYLLKLKFDAQSLQWHPIFSILLFVISFAVGYTGVPIAILSEIFPENIKSIASSLTTLSCFLYGFAISKTYQPIVDSFGESYAFWLYAGLSLLLTPYTLFLLPETRGKTFQEIQNDLR